jgi:hypothetical protein
MGAPRADDGSRRGPLASRRLVLTVAWILATCVGLVVAHETKIGPVVLTITQGHGVHLGDVLGFLVCYGAVGLGQTLWPPGRSTDGDDFVDRDPDG